MKKNGTIGRKDDTHVYTTGERKEGRLQMKRTVARKARTAVVPLIT